MVTRPAPVVNFVGSAVNAGVALVGITVQGRLVPPVESFVTFFPSLWHVTASAIVPVRDKPTDNKGNTGVTEVEFLEPLVEFSLLRLGSVCSSLLLSYTSSAGIYSMAGSPGTDAWRVGTGKVTLVGFRVNKGPATGVLAI